MIWLNQINGADLISQKYYQKIVDEFKPPLTAVVLGCAYGGEVEWAGNFLGEKGNVYGYDTFDDLHPKHLAEDETDFEAVCMNAWYTSKEYGTDKLHLDYIQNQLDVQGLNNVHLIKGLVNPDSCKDMNIHYCLLDMDILASMQTGFEAVKNQIVKGGYLLIHDVLPPQHLPKLHKFFYEGILPGGMWEVVEERKESYLSVWRKL